MGAYSNPQIVVDTQSGQHWRNLQENITRTMERVGASFAQAAKRNREYGEIAEKNTKSIQTITSSLDISNPAFNISEAAKPLIDKYNQLQNDIAFGRSKDVSSDREACRKMEDMIIETKNGIGNLASFAGKTKEWLKNQNKVNGMAPNNDPNAVNFAGILSNNTPGKVEIFFDLENYKTVFNAFESEGKDEKGNSKYKSEAFLSLPTDKLKSYLDNNGGIKLIPSITPTLDSLKNNPTMFDNKGNLNEDFYRQDYREVSRNDKSLITNNKFDKGTYIVEQQPILIPDEDKILPILKQNIEAQIAGMEDINEIQAFYNHYVCQDSPVGLNETLSPMQRAETADYLAKTFMNTVPTIDNKNLPSIKTQVTKQTKDTSSNKSSVDASTAEEKNQARIDKEVAKLIKSKKGSVSNKGMTLSLINGRWSLTETKTGLPVPYTDSITSPTELATYMGGSQPKDGVARQRKELTVTNPNKKNN